MPPNSEEFLVQTALHPPPQITFPIKKKITLTSTNTTILHPITLLIVERVSCSSHYSRPRFSSIIYLRPSIIEFQKPLATVHSTCVQKMEIKQLKYAIYFGP